MRKPMLNSEELVQHMIRKGIKFTIINEEDAKKHLSEHNNYFKLTSYRKNYTKYSSGINAEKYERLEFAYLLELARLDTIIRNLLLEMALDIEHFLKVHLINAVEANNCNGEDGYKIVKDFIFDNYNPCTDSRAENTAKRSSNYRKSIQQNRNNPYCSGLVEK